MICGLAITRYSIPIAILLCLLSTIAGQTENAPDSDTNQEVAEALELLTHELTQSLTSVARDKLWGPMELKCCRQGRYYREVLRPQISAFNVQVHTNYYAYIKKHWSLSDIQDLKKLIDIELDKQLMEQRMQYLVERTISGIDMDSMESYQHSYNLGDAVGLDQSVDALIEPSALIDTLFWVNLTLWYEPKVDQSYSRNDDESYSRYVRLW